VLLRVSDSTGGSKATKVPLVHEPRPHPYPGVEADGGLAIQRAEDGRPPRQRMTRHVVSRRLTARDASLGLPTVGRVTCLLVLAFYCATCGLAAAGRGRVEEFLPVRSDAQSADNWQLYWRPGTTTPPPRRVLPVRATYIEPESSEPWMDCVHANGLASSLGQTPWPRGTKVLFVGNSYVRELAETAVLDVPDGAIMSMHYQVQRNATEEGCCTCLCPIAQDRSGGYRAGCEMTDLLTAPMPTENGVKICNSRWQRDGTACNDNAAVVRLYDNGILAQLINHSAHVLPLDIAVPLILGLPLSDFDVVVANTGNSAGATLSACPGPEGEAMRAAFQANSGILHRPLLQVANVTSALARAGFKGDLFWLSTRMWQPIEVKIEESLNRAKSAGLPFAVHASPVLHAGAMRYKAVDTCGEAKAKGNHACIPGPPLWMVEALRAEYATLTSAKYN